MMDEDEGEGRFRFLNDWPQRRFMALGMATILFVLLFAVARMMHTDLPYTGIVGLVLLPLIILVPGAAILRILRIHKLDFSRAAYYSLALGIMLVMVIGGGLTILHYTTSIEAPFTLEFISTTYSAVVALLLFGVVLRDSDYRPSVNAAKIDLATALTWAFAVLLPLVVVVGTYVADFEGDRSVIFYALVAMCVAPLLLMVKSTKNYEVLILSLSLSLLLHRGLMTNYLMGYDVFSEYYTAFTSNANGYWDVFHPFGANTAMSMTTFVPMLTNLTSIPILDILKVVFPVLFSFTALAIYKIVQGQLGPRPALAASFLFIGYQAFYALMVQLTKQQLAEIFMLLFFMAALDTSISRRNRRAFVIIGLFGVVASHYALAYICIGIVVGMVVLDALWHLVVKIRERVGGKDQRPVHRWFAGVTTSWFKEQWRERIVSIDIAVIFLAIFYVWFSVTASGIMLQYGENVNQYVGPVNNESGGGTLLLYQMDALEFLLIDYGNGLHNVEKYLVVLAQAICIIGVLYAMRRFGSINGSRMSRDFVIIGALAAMIIIGCYTIPRLSFSFYFARFFHVTFLFISGFFMVGLYAIAKVFRGKHTKGDDIAQFLKNDRVTITVGSIFLVLLLLFNTGTIYHASGDFSSSFALDPDISWSVYSDQDVVTAKWLSDLDHRGDYKAVADWHRFPIFGGEGVPVEVLKYQWTENQTGKFLYLSTWNVEKGWCISSNRNGSSIQTYTPLSDILSQVDNRTEVVYSTEGGAKVVFVPESEPSTNPLGPPFHTYETTPIYVLSGLALLMTASACLAILLRWRK